MGEDELPDLVEANDLSGVRRWLNDHPSYEVADGLARLDAVSAGMVFRLLDKDDALEVFEELDPVDQQQILVGLRDQSFRELIEGMDPDDRAKMLGEAPAKVVKRVLAGLSHKERRMTAALLGYPDGSVGRVVTPETVALPVDISVEQALELVRAKGAGAETVYTLAVVEPGRRMLGVVELRDLVLSSPQTRLAELTDVEVPRAGASDSAEDAARLMAEANLLNLPVVDSENRLLGFLTADDAMEVIEAADTEDVARQAGASPWAGHYMFVSVLKLARIRVVWLMLLLVAAVLTVAVTDYFEPVLAELPALAAFMPLLIGTGGNTGAQAATAAVRAIAVGEVRGSDLPRVVWRECRTGLLLGAALAALGAGVATVFAGWRIAVVVATALVVICAWASTVGGSMPLLARKVGIDPAVVSAPMVTTLVDATGLIIYFLTARLVLGL